MLRFLAICTTLVCLCCIARAADPLSPSDPLCRLTGGKTQQVNGLWIENPPEMKFGEGRSKVVIADLKGPGIITMIHFALPAKMSITRDVVLRIWWDGEKNPSVEAPLCDFFCDPNGALERVESVFVNKKRGWNCYFPMPFAKSARVEVSMDSSRYPNADWAQAPCYSYVHYRKLQSVPDDFAYFHAAWTQKTQLLGSTDCQILSARGKGQWIGWSMSIHSPGSGGYPVDENVNFYVDGEKEPSIVWQGLEDGFGFSWGFPEAASSFSYTGYQPWYNGAAAYRFNDTDRISFEKSLKMTVGFGPKELGFKDQFSKPGSELEISAVAYWYQKEPHAAFPALLASSVRAPTLALADKARVDAGETLSLTCGSTRSDIEYLAPGWDFTFKRGYSFAGWNTQVNHCWADFDTLEFDITCPKGSSGVLKLYIIDGDGFMGGRKESITVAGKLIGEYESFGAGQWIEVPVASSDSRTGRIPVVMKNLKEKSNAVVSLVRFEKAK